MTPTPRRKNSEIQKSIGLDKIAELVGGKLLGDPQTTITGVAGITEAGKGDISFLADSKNISLLEKTEASAVIVPLGVDFPKKPLIIASHPSQAFTKVISFFTPSSKHPSAGIHPSAIIDPTCVIAKSAVIGPGVVIEEGVKIGDRAMIAANTFIGKNSFIGDEVCLHPHVTILHGTQIGHRSIIHSGSVIGSDGFGYETIDGAHIKIPQIGSVVIEEDVEIGANVCIDRARLDKTVIKKGSKIDNLVQIAHNVVIGEHNMVVSQAGISGSVKTGKNVIIAGQVGLVGHIELGDNVIIAAGSGVTKSVPANTVMLGGPARPIQEQRKIYVLISKLPDLFKDLLEIKRKLNSK